MNRTFFITAGSFAILTMIGAAHVYENQLDSIDTHKTEVKTPPPSETRPRTVEQLIEEALPAVEQGTQDLKTAAVGNLIEELGSEEFSKSAIPAQTGEKLAKAISSFAGELDGSKENAELKTRIAGLLAFRTNTATSRDYAVKTLDSGSEAERAAVLAGAQTRGGVRGKKVYTKILELNDKGLVPQEMIPSLLRRTGGKEAFEPILALMKSTDSRTLAAQCAVALQDYQKPELMGPIVEKLEALGMLDKQRGQLPWIDKKTFALHMEKADGMALTRGLKLIRARPSLIKGSVKAVERGLESVDPANRGYAAEAIKRAVGTKNMDPKEGSALLAKRLDRETEPVLRAEITGGLELAREMMEPSPAAAQP